MRVGWVMDYEVEIGEIKHDIVLLQKDVIEIKITQPMLQATLEKNVEANEKLVETLHEIEKTMISMNNKMNVQSKEIDTIKNEMEENNTHLTNKINKVKERVDKVDAEGQFNIRLFFQKYFPWIVILVGGGMFILSKFVKF